MHVTSDSDTSHTMSRSPSPPRSPKRAVYFVQSPSRDSNDESKASSTQATPSCSSTDSPSHTSSDRVSRAYSSTARLSAPSKRYRRKSSSKVWSECSVILEEGDYDDLYEEDELSGQCRAFFTMVGFAILFTIFCLIIWGASKPYKPEIRVEVCLLLFLL